MFGLPPPDDAISSTIVRVLTALALLVLCATSIRRTARPPTPVPATAPDTVFSAERAMRHVDEIAVRPHAMGMPDHDRVRDYVLAQLTALGVKPQIQQATAIGTRYQEAGRVQNILAWLPGGGVVSATRGKAVLLMAHYDGVEAGPAAGDDGAGSAALLETLRALRARKQPLAHDVIALFTDGEEAGLLGAAAFVREHPWAKDVAVVLNFEARGTSGRSFMFETGPGNLDVVRMLRAARDVSAASVFTAVYRAIPNDTDLSELAVLGLPALNFAFVDGVERYHTSHDDVAHLDPGSVQHHGAQMVAVARAFANDSLPRPKTGDAVFFDFPVIGLVIYPESFALPLAILAMILVAIAVVRDRKGIIAGVVVALVSVALSALAAQVSGTALSWLHAHLPWGGAPRWRGVYAAAVALIAVAITVGCVSVGKRWATERGLHVGAIIVWLLLTLVVSVRAAGASYLFVWPVVFATAAILVTRWKLGAEWIAAGVTLILLTGFVYGVTVVTLGVIGIGAIVLGVLTSLVALILSPQLTVVAGEARAAGALWAAGAALALIVIGAFVVRSSAEHPASTALVYAENADSSDAWFGAFTGWRSAWTRQAVGQATVSPAWTARLSEGGLRFAARRVARAPLAPPNAVFVRDTMINGARRVVLRVTAPPGTTGLSMRASGAPVLTSSIDGRVVDTTRYRFHTRDWIMEYSAVPDSGAIVALSIPAGAKIDFELAARRPGIPSVSGVTIPARPPNVVPSQSGDVSIVYRRFVF
jgi:hypothetical protein